MAHEHHQNPECECGEPHEHEEESLKGKIIKIAVTVALLIGAVVVERRCNLPTWQLLLVYLIPYLIVGFDTLKEAAEGLAHGEAFNEDFLMSLATILASSLVVKTASTSFGICSL